MEITVKMRMLKEVKRRPNLDAKQPSHIPVVNSNIHTMGYENKGHSKKGS